MPAGNEDDLRVNILLVDDQPGKLIAHEAVLAELGENVIKASTGRQALEYLLRKDFAVILLDVNMPEMDGFQIAELIRQRPRFEKTPIIFITGYNTTDFDRLKGYSLGAVDYLFLPVIPEVLKAKVTVFVELAKQSKIIRTQAETLAEHNRAQARQLQVIQKLNQELQEANHELEAFSYTVSHDLRSPLRALKGYAEVLLDDYGEHLGVEARNCLDCLQRAAISMDRLTQDLLNYTRVVRQPLELESISVGAVLTEIMAMNPQYASPGVLIKTEEPLGNVLAHFTLLGQCLSNLIDNAIKFARPGVPALVHISTQRLGDRVRIWVVDNGIGIDPAFHKKVFGIFERVGDLKKNQGTGIGLAIVARAVQRMRGNCGVESDLNKGSRFWIELSAGS